MLSGLPSREGIEGCVRTVELQNDEEYDATNDEQR